MQVVDVLRDSAVETPGNREVVKDREVLKQLAKPYAAGVRADRYIELRSE